MSRYFLLLGLVVLGMIVYRSYNSARSSPVHNATHDEESPVAKPKEVSKPFEAQVAPEIPASQAPNATSSSPSARIPAPSEEIFPSKQDFIEKFRQRPFHDWFSKAIPLTTSTELAEGHLDLSHESGIIDVDGREFEYRYEVGGINNDSCVSILPPTGRLILGSFGNKTLAFWKLPHPNAYIYGIQNKHFFVSYRDQTESRQFEGYREPVSPLNNWAILYYARQDNGNIIYMGKLERFTYPDANLRMGGYDFCRHSFDRNSGVE